jgi:hypothetical protein
MAAHWRCEMYKDCSFKSINIFLAFASLWRRIADQRCCLRPQPGAFGSCWPFAILVRHRYADDLDPDLVWQRLEGALELWPRWLSELEAFDRWLQDLIALAQDDGGQG